MDIRLKKQKDFDFVFKKGKRIYTKSHTLLFIENTEFKFGISLSKKHGKAHQRNRIKRLIRACVKQLIKDRLKPYFIVVLPKVKDNYSYDEFYTDLSYSLQKGKIISD